MAPIGKEEYIADIAGKVKCKCGSREVVKAGFSRGKQRYKCNCCQKRFVVVNSSEEQKVKMKSEFLELYLEGLGFRSIGRLLGVSHVTVQNWLKEKAKSVVKEEVRYARFIEIDEVYFYTKRKKTKRWMWLAVCKESRRILGFELGSRSAETLKRLYAKIKHIVCERYYTDEFSSFRSVIPSSKHTSSKRHTTTIEGVNSAVRHYLARFRRKSKCYTKNENMLSATMDLFIPHYNTTRKVA